MDQFLRSLFGLEGKTALVTGGATGIGRIVTDTLVRAGARVLITSRKAEACEELAAELNALSLNGHVEGFGGDVATEGGVARIAAEVDRRLSGKLDILVNNAGKTWGAPLESYPYSAWQDVVSVNLTGAFALTQRLLPLLKAAATDKDPSRIINLGSVTGTSPIGNNAYAYAASKAAVHHLTRILAQELASEHVTVNAFAPGPFDSRMMKFVTADSQRRAAMIRSVPLRRLGCDADIAAATLMLCGKGGSYVTGAIIPIDGGKHIAAAGTRDEEDVEQIHSDRI